MSSARDNKTSCSVGAKPPKCSAGPVRRSSAIEVAQAARVTTPVRDMARSSAAGKYVATRSISSGGRSLSSDGVDFGPATRLLIVSEAL
eukprot:scaffold66518_cov52-Phaeocystis_antarctica.AAC.2